MFKNLKVRNFKGFHWAVILLSLALTFFAWSLSSNQVQANIEARFAREAEETVNKVIARMKQYEDILWGGVATLKSHSSGFDRSEFKRFSKTLNIVGRYPGINGIGVIYRVARKDKEKFLLKVRKEEPNFRIFPEHSKPVLYPITYIEPEDTNLKSIGLDMAHERNRFEAMKKAEVSGEAQVTGPIVLVQDDEKTPGFLFYAPFYKDTGKKKMEGLVYAPFIFKKLMRGVLGNEDKRVDVIIYDGNSKLYEDHQGSDSGIRGEREFSRQEKVRIYGRRWRFEVTSNTQFRKTSSNNQPYFVLSAAIVIDLLLFMFFLALNRSREEAVVLAEEQTIKAINAAKLATLGEMASGIAHEINNPLAILSGNTTRLKSALESEKLDQKKALEICQKIENTSERISKIINSMKLLSRDGSKDPFVETSVKGLISDVAGISAEKFKHREIRFEISEVPEHVKVLCRPVELSQVLVNLLNNAYDATVDSEDPFIILDVRIRRGKVFISVSDSGPGIPTKIADKIMNPFFTTKDVGKGTGLGLSISKKIIENHKGSLTLDKSSKHTTFVIELRKA